jgi:hypothetical protein
MNMMERPEAERVTQLTPFQSGKWRLEGRIEKNNLIMDAHLHDEGVEDVHEHAEYKPFSTKEIQGPFYLLIDDRSTSGSFPHGDASYIEEWDVTLLRQEMLDGSEKELTPTAYTVLAHEMGHRIAIKKGLTKHSSDPDFNRFEDEIIAWQAAIQEFGSNKKFDHEHAALNMDANQIHLADKQTKK